MLMFNEYIKGLIFTYKLRRSIVKARKIKNFKIAYLNFDPYKAIKLRYNLG